MGMSLADAERCGIGHLHPDNKQAEPSQPKPSKYRNVITTYKGVKYASKAEAVRAEQLDWQLSAGLIRAWTRQPTYHLGCPEHTYRADFHVIGRDAEIQARRAALATIRTESAPHSEAWQGRGSNRTGGLTHDHHPQPHAQADV